MKKIFIAGLILLLFFSFACVSASELNDTDDITFTEYNSEITESDVSIDITNQNNNNDAVECDNQFSEVSANGSYVTDEKSTDNDILASSTTYFNEDYYAVIPNMSMLKGNVKVLHVTLYPQFSGNQRFTYDFHLKIYDKSDNLVMSSERYSGEGEEIAHILYTIDSGNLNSGEYVVKLISAKGNVESTGFLYIDSDSRPDFEVDIGDTIINEGSSGKITMIVTQKWIKDFYDYDFVLEISNSKGNVVISKSYTNSNTEATETLYYTIKANMLSPGEYTVLAKSVVFGENYILKAAGLTIKSNGGSAGLGYGVTLKDNYVDYGKTNTFSLNVFKYGENPANAYAFYVYFYDSDNNLVTYNYCKGSSYGSISFKIDMTKFKVGTYFVQARALRGEILNDANLIVRNSLNYTYILDVPDTNITYGDNGNITINIHPVYEGDYNYDFYLKVYDSSYNELISKRYSNSFNADYVENYSFNSMSLSSGTYTVRLVNYNGDSQNVYSKLNVKSRPSSDGSYLVTTYSEINIEKGQSGKITIFISPADSKSKRYNYDFYVKVYDPKGRQKISQRFKNEGYSSCNEYVTINSTTLARGEYTIELVDAKNLYVMDSGKLVIGPVLTHSDYSVNVLNCTMKQFSEGDIVMYIYESSDGSYTYDYNLKIYDADDNELICKRFTEFDLSYWYTKDYVMETYKIDRSIFAPGNYTIKIFNVRDNYLMGSANLEIKPIPHEDYPVQVNDIIADDASNGIISIKYNLSNQKDYTCDFYLKIYDSNNVEKISERFNNSYRVDSWVFYSTVGDINYTIDNNVLGIGKYTIKIIDSKDNYLLDTANLVISKKSIITVNDVTADYNQNKYLVVTLKDKSGQAITGEKILVNFNDVKIFTTDSNGQVKLSTKGLNPNTYTATITFYGNDLYGKSEATAKIVVNKLKVSLSSDDITAVYNVEGYLVATFKDNNGNPLEGFNISVDFNGIKTLTTNANGQVEVSTNGSVPQTYTATISFAGDGFYDKSSTQVSVVVKKATPKITAKAKTFKRSVKTKKYTITLKNNLNKGIKNAKVKIKINKKTYTAKTNKKGKATFKIKKLTKKGTIKAKITYKGNSYYNKVTKKVKIKIK